MTPERWNTLIRLRRIERDRCVQDLAATTRHQARIEELQSELRSEYIAALAAARESDESAGFNVTSLTVHRSHLRQLLEALDALELEWKRAKDRRESDRARLVAAEQRREMLERLSDRARVETERRAEQQESRERDEAWRPPVD